MAKAGSPIAVADAKIPIGSDPPAAIRSASAVTVFRINP
jgi:hypothetical protein